MKKIILLSLLSIVFITSIFAQKKLSKNTRALPSFWRSCEMAIKANDTTAIKNVVKFPVRMNLLGSEYGDNPNLNLTQFLEEEKNLKLYNFRKYFPVENKNLKEYNLFNDYTFSKDCKYYEVEMSRKVNANEGSTTSLFLEERNGVFKIFAFGIENPYQTIGE
jgi:hypothetical protein